MLDGWLVCLQQRRGTSETSEDTQALQGLNGDAGALPGSLGFAATATPSPLSMAQVENHSTSATRALPSSSSFCSQKKSLMLLSEPGRTTMLSPAHPIRT